MKERIRLIENFFHIANNLFDLKRDFSGTIENNFFFLTFENRRSKTFQENKILCGHATKKLKSKVVHGLSSFLSLKQEISDFIQKKKRFLGYLMRDKKVISANKRRATYPSIISA